jgi:hypothetical protein
LLIESVFLESALVEPAFLESVFIEYLSRSSCMADVPASRAGIVMQIAARRYFFCSGRFASPALRALQLHSAGYTLRIVQFTPANAVEHSRPRGVSLTALALGALTAIQFVTALLYVFREPLAAASFSEQLLACMGRGVLLLAVWNCWQGRDWARIVVLLWAFVIAAKDISALIDRDENLVSLMSQPLRFFQAILAIFLLYFLNTRSVRAWFKKVSSTAADLIAEHLTGRLCTAVTSSGAAPRQEWRLAFEHEAELTLHCPWRIVLDDNLAFASNSPNNTESPPIPQQPAQLLENLRVKAVRVAPRSSDLFISFEMGIELQSWSIDPAPAAGAASVAAYLPAPAASPATNAQQWKFSDPTLTVIATFVGIQSQVIAAPISGQDAAEND